MICRRAFISIHRERALHGILDKATLRGVLPGVTRKRLIKLKLLCCVCFVSAIERRATESGAHVLVLAVRGQGHTPTDTPIQLPHRETVFTIGRAHTAVRDVMLGHGCVLRMPHNGAR